RRPVLHGTLVNSIAEQLGKSIMSQTMENEVMNGTNPYLEKFERFENQTNQPAWLFLLRKAGIVSFAEQGFPTLKDEDWRFTNVAPIAKLPFKPMLDGAAEKGVADVLPRSVFAKLSGSRLVFVNGHFAADLSS